MASSEEIGLQRLDNGLNSHSQLVFHDDTLPRFNCAAATSPHRRAGDPGPKTRELSAFIDDKIFPPVDRDRYFPSQAEFRRSIFAAVPHRRDHPLSDGSDDEDDDEDDEDEDEDDDEGDGEVEALVAVDDPSHNKSHNTSSTGTTKAKLRSSLGSNRELMVKDSSFVQTANNARASPSENHSHQQGRVVHLQNAVTIAVTDGDVYYSQFLQGPEGSGSAYGQKESGVENGCGFSGRKEAAFSSESGDSLRAILSDPITGALMDDAVILPCGHSFGSSGMQQVIRMKTCFTCSQSVSEESVAPNLSLRAAVLAFRREEESQFYRASKRRRERFEQDKSNYCDSYIDPPRGRGVQFPFSVTDRVIIKGNKRTPQRFVGREAVVTTQCLNGWYVVKTLDNAESVKLQYRSLAKVSDNSSSKPLPSKAPNWL